MIVDECHFPVLKTLKQNLLMKDARKYSRLLKLFFSKGEEKLMFFSQKRQFIG